jgi:GT2 family glycosyltransferase
MNCNNATFNIVDKKSDVLLLNSDTKVTKGFIEEMSRILYSDPKIATVNPRSNNATVWSIPMSGCLANQRCLSYAYFKWLKNKIPEKYICPTVHGFCMLIKRKVIDKYGLFDEVYGKGYAEENDFSMRIREGGYKCASANHAFIFHYENRSFGPERQSELVKKNSKILLGRYPEYDQLIQEYLANIKEPKPL